MITLNKIIDATDDYLCGRVGPTDLVRLIDDAVSDDSVYKYDEKAKNIILHYQDIFALYVENEVSRREDPSYFGPAEFTAFVRDLKQDLAKL